MKTSCTIALTSCVLACFGLATTAMAEVETACCLPLPQGGCQNLVTPESCGALGGWSFGACADCADFLCPPAACIGATESCTDPHSTAGCDDWVCCNIVCSVHMPECCDPAHGWDASCVQWMSQNDCIWDADEGPFSACYPDGRCEESFDSYWIYLQAGQRFANPNAACMGDLNGDGIDDGCACPTDVPATSSYVLIAGAVLLLVASAVFLLRRRSAP